MEAYCVILEAIINAHMDVFQGTPVLHTEKAGKILTLSWEFLPAGKVSLGFNGTQTPYLFVEYPPS